MTIVVYSQSKSFEAHINRVVDGNVTYRSTLLPTVELGQIHLVHAQFFVNELPDWLDAVSNKGIFVAIASDNPQVEDLLSFTEMGVQGYFNSYMSAPHYAQLVRLLANGQSWYPPILLNQTFALARSSIKRPSTVNLLDVLTKRECDVAFAVAEGKSNKLVANTCKITERTVKAHLTQIFKKLKVKDRVALVIYLGKFDFVPPPTHSSTII